MVQPTHSVSSARAWLRRGVGAAFSACLLLTSVALADGVDGIYKPTRVEGHVRVGGKRVNLPIGALRDALLKKGLVLVRDNRMPIQRAKWGPVLDRMGLFGIRGKTRVSGPDLVVLRQTGGIHAGRAAKPLEVKLRGRYKRLPVTMAMNTRLDTTVEGTKLKMNAPLRISVIGLTLKGTIQMDATLVRPL